LTASSPRSGPRPSLLVVVSAFDEFDPLDVAATEREHVEFDPGLPASLVRAAAGRRRPRSADVEDRAAYARAVVEFPASPLDVGFDHLWHDARVVTSDGR
jgi:hypothetical protein